MKLVIGGKYNWRNQDERLVYLGKALSNGWWHQFALVDSPDNVWCEVRDSELEFFEETAEA
jgi:hypothetical protein